MRFLPALFLVLLAACSSPVKNTAASSIDDLKAAAVDDASRLTNPSDAFTFDPAKPQVLVTKKYSRITVPANTFVRKDGAAPQSVRLVFTEYQTAGEIIASKLPMTYTDPKSETIDFESAGMFEIRAYEGKETLEIKAGKQIAVELMTPVDGKFNFYTLNDNTRAWSEVAKNLSPVPNRFLAEQEERLEELEKLTEQQPKQTVKLLQSDQLFDIMVDPIDYPEFENMGGVLWKYAGDAKAKNPMGDPHVFLQRYEFMRLQPKAGRDLVYDVQFSSKKDTVTVSLAPVFKGNAAKKHAKQLAEQMAQFNAALLEQEKIRSQNRNEAKLLRRFNIGELGVYNYDRQFKDDGAIPVIAEFTFDGKKQAEFPLTNVYLLPKGKLAAVKYDVKSAKLFAINPYEQNQLVAITGEGDVYALSGASLRKLGLGAFRNKEKIINLEKVGKPAKTGTEIDNILAGL